MLIAALAAVLVAGSSWNQPTTNAPLDYQGERRFAGLCASYVSPTLPAVWLAVYKQGKVVAIACSGFRDVASQDPAKLSDQVGYGSITKVFTATMIASLVSDAKLDYDRPVFEYLPDLQGRFDDEKRKITLRFLVSHRAGFDAATKEPVGDFSDGRKYRQTYVKTGLATPLLFLPGSKTNYSNIGIGLATEVAETVSQESWESLVSSRVLKPLGLDTIEPYPEPNLSNVHSYEVKVSPDGNSTVVDTASRPMNYRHRFGPSASLRGTVEDLMKFGAAFLTPQRLSPVLRDETIYRGLVEPPPGFSWTLAALTTDSAKFAGAGDSTPDAGLRMSGGNTAGRYRAVSRLGVYRRSQTVIAVMTNALGPDTDNQITRLAGAAYRLVN